MFIGDKKIQETKDTLEKTPGGTEILEVQYEDGSLEHFSKLMYDQVVSEEACDLSKLRDKRVQYVIAATLTLLREYGLKVGDTPYFAVLLNQSLNFNIEEATKELWAGWMPKPLSLDDVDLVTVDRVLASKKKTLNDVLEGPGNASV